MGYKDKEKNKAYMKEYHRIHPPDKEKTRERYLKYKETHSDYIKQYNKEYKAKNKEYYAEYSDKYGRKLDQRFKRSINSAKNRNKEWLLTFEQFKFYAEQPCTYCNNLLGESPKGSGLDRLDNSIGYIEGNVCSSCGFCNKLRGDRLSHEETKLVIDFILKIRNLK